MCSNLCQRCGQGRGSCCGLRSGVVVMLRVRSVPGHVSPVRCSLPVRLCSSSVTRLLRYYAHLRLPVILSLRHDLLLRAQGRPPPRFSHLLAGAPVRGSLRLARARPTGSPRLLRRVSVGLETVSHPGWEVGLASLLAAFPLLPAGVLKPSARSTRSFRDSHLQGRLHPLPLFLARFAAYASSMPLPSCLQGCILGLRLAVTKAGFPPATQLSRAEPLPRPVPQ